MVLSDEIYYDNHKDPLNRKRIIHLFYEVAQDALCGYTCTLYNYEVPLDGISSKCQFSSRQNNTVYREMFASD